MKKIVVLILAITNLALFSCSNAINDIQNDDVVVDSKTVLANRHFTNTLINGKAALDKVLEAKYKNILDFYGEDSIKFKNMVNASLSALGDSATELNSDSIAGSMPLYSYNALQSFKECYVEVTYKDGTSEMVDVNTFQDRINALNTSGESNMWDTTISSLKIIGSTTSAMENAKNSVLDKLYDMSENYFFDEDMLTGVSILDESAFFALLDTGGLLAELTDSGLFKFAVGISKFAGPLSAGLDFLGLIGGGPSENEIVNMKLDLIIDMIKGLYQNLEYISEQIFEVGSMIEENEHLENVQKCQEAISALNNLLNGVNSKPVYEDAVAAAESNVLLYDTEISKFLIYAAHMHDLYRQYIDRIAAHEDDPAKKKEIFGSFVPISIQITTPYSETYNWISESGSSSSSQVDNNYILTNISLDNPNIKIPMSYDSLLYLTNVIISRFHLNNMCYDGKIIEQDKYNSNSALIYLRSNDFIGELRDKINSAYGDLILSMSGLEESLNNVTKNNLDSLVNKLNTSWVYKVNSMSTTTKSYGGVTQYDYKGNFRSHVIETYAASKDDFNFTPAAVKIMRNGTTFSSFSRSNTGSPLSISASNPYSIAFVSSYYNPTYGSPSVSGSYLDPYNNIIGLSLSYLGGGPVGSAGLTNGYYGSVPSRLLTGINHQYLNGYLNIDDNELDLILNKTIDQDEILDDAFDVIKSHYKARTDQLMQFAATLAALEVYLALYLDDAAFNEIYQ